MPIGKKPQQIAWQVSRTLNILSCNQDWFRCDETDQRSHYQTAQREEIKDHRSESGYHWGTDREEGVSPQCPPYVSGGTKRKKSLSLSTLYAVLKEFSRHGIIKTLQFDQMENRYETDLKEHINLICGRCKKILDYKVPIIVDQKGVAKKTGFSITNTRLEYYGCCRECRESKGSNRASWNGLDEPLSTKGGLDLLDEKGGEEPNRAKHGIGCFPNNLVGVGTVR